VKVYVIDVRNPGKYFYGKVIGVAASEERAKEIFDLFKSGLEHYDQRDLQYSLMEFNLDDN
jgi:hypothetical protein